MTLVTPELAGTPFRMSLGGLVLTPAIILERPCNPHDLAAVLYTASAYGIAQVWLDRPRVDLDPDGPPAHPHRDPAPAVPVQVVVGDPDPVDRYLGWVPVVAVERHQPAHERMGAFVHPAEAVYVFGPEDGDLSAATLERADWVVEIPTRHSLYLSGAVTCTLYERERQRTSVRMLLEEASCP
jgi:tRNA G18 (ribose-2'-O)-methylase SpoU